jgi:Family of unknown function (DUF6361)
MTSFFAWIDHSEADRRRMLNAVDMFREQGTRDELGLSGIRDGFADLFFPGTGALQTRARYFLFVPWMFRFLEQERVRSSDMEKRARQFEARLIDALLGSEEHQGTIGARARGALQSMPSSLYWTGLGRLQVCLFQGSSDDYYRSLDTYYRNSSGRQKTNDGEPVEPLPLNWHPMLPPAPEAFEALASSRAEQVPVSFSLEPGEAEYLAERIRGAVGKSLFAWFLDELKEHSDAPFAWAHELATHLPDRLKRPVAHARAFSELMAGAVILYNGMVAEGPPLREEVRAKMQGKFETWFNEIAAQSDTFARWDRHDFWTVVKESGARPSEGTRAFVDRWIDCTLSADTPLGLWASAEARALIRNREWDKKKSLARLHNPHARETWNGPTGLFRMDFRWLHAQDILNDILAAQGHA